eukprot:15656-Heterococcus_DN1.PRE.2
MMRIQYHVCSTAHYFIAACSTTDAQQRIWYSRDDSSAAVIHTSDSSSSDSSSDSSTTATKIFFASAHVVSAYCTSSMRAIAAVRPDVYHLKGIVCAVNVYALQSYVQNPICGQDPSRDARSRLRIEAYRGPCCARSASLVRCQLRALHCAAVCVLTVKAVHLPATSWRLQVLCPFKSVYTLVQLAIAEHAAGQLVRLLRAGTYMHYPLAARLSNSYITAQ